jgi:iron complex outermembrane receptor protein
VRGLDFSFNMSLKDTGVGNFNLTLNASRMLEYSRSPSPGIQALLDARAAGKINIGTNIPESGSLLGIDGIPKWRGSASLIWSLGGFQVGSFAQYTGPVTDDDVTDATGANWAVKGQVTANLYVQYEFAEGALAKTRIRVGARNLTNARPPIESGSYGYLGSLYQPYQRYWYASLRKEF